jgi:hypothetical protein
VLEITPCRVDLREGIFKYLDETCLHVLESCSRVYVVLPKYISPSDIMPIWAALKPLIDAKRPLVFVTQSISDNVREDLLHLSSGGSVIDL